MALSQSTNYNLTAANIINRSLNLIGAVAPWESPSSDNTAMCLDFLNMMIKRWVTDGIHLWTQHEGVIIFDASVGTYTFPNMDLANGSVGVVRADNFVDTELTAAAVTSATALTVTSNAGIAVTDKIIVVLDSGARHVTTVAGITASTGITLTDALPGPSAATNHVYSYPVAVTQANLFNPRQIFNVRLRDSQGLDRNLTEFSRSDYLAISNKELTGTPMGYYIDDQLVNKKIDVYLVPTNLNEHLRFTYVKALDDLDNITEEVEFPTEWLDAIVFNLAVVISKPFGKEEKVGKRNDPDSIAGIAWEAKEAALGFDSEHVDVQFNPSWDRG